MSNLNVGFIGAGVTAEKYLEVIKHYNIFNIIGITSKTNKNCLKLKKKYKIKKIFSNYSNLASDNSIDVIIIIVSADQISKVLQDIIPFRKPFLTEKPISLNLSDAKKIKNLVLKYKTKNIVALNRRYYSVIDNALKEIKKNGKLLGFAIEGHERFYNLNKKKINPLVLKNWIFANSCHTIDLLRFFGGEIKNMKTEKVKYKKIKSNFSSLIKFKNGIIGSYRSFWYSPGGWSIELYGEGITAVIKPLEQGYTINNKNKIVNLPVSNHDKMFKPGIFKILKNFENYVKKNKKKWPDQTILDNFNTIKLIDQIYNEKN